MNAEDQNWMKNESSKFDRFHINFNIKDWFRQIDKKKNILNKVEEPPSAKGIVVAVCVSVSDNVCF